MTAFLPEAELGAIRALFPATERYAYLITAAVAPHPRPVVEAIAGFLEASSRSGGIHFDRWLEKIETCRGRLARFLGARPEEIAFTKNTTQGLQIAASAIPWEAGENVIVSDMEFPANYFPWLQLERTRDVICIELDAVGGRICLAALEAAMDEKTRAVAVSWVQFSNGFRTDLEEISRLCEARGAFLVVDAIQGAGALELDVSKLGRRTLVAGGCHKWLLTPCGLGYLYCPRELLEELRPANWGWISMSDPMAMTHELRLLPAAARFEEGNLNVAAIHGLDAALELLERAGVPRIEAHVLAVTDRLAEGLTRRGYQVASPREAGEQSGILLFRHREHGSHAIVKELLRHDVVVVERDGGVRASPHFFNGPADVDRLLESLPS